MQGSSGADEDWSKHSFTAEALWDSFHSKANFLYKKGPFVEED